MPDSTEPSDSLDLPQHLEPRTHVAFGGLVEAWEADPAVWLELSGVGPTLSGRLAAAASRGELRRPDDLLQVPGIGVRMAAMLAPSIRWDGRGPGSQQGEFE